ncbi:hypothetical protein FRC06_005749 [Ceratobasidium sp. 370]|nr:hypothetical protein FRC06_005749 [Ceratobasidium sp. 370]
MPKPTGNPEANQLHEQAVEIDQELEGMEYTHVLDDSPPPPSDMDTIQLSSDSEPEILNTPVVPPLSQSRVATTVEHTATPAQTFHTVTCKARPSSQPVQPRNPLDAATAHLASILSPGTEQESINQQREDDIGHLTILALNDTIRDLRAELSQERQRSHALENELRNREMQRQVEVQVREQLRQLTLTHRSDIAPSRSPVLSSEVLQLSSDEPFDKPFWSETPPRRTSGEAHPSWMPGPPPERSDASGSGIRCS